jgi:ankyrin repeat protein
MKINELTSEEIKKWIEKNKPSRRRKKILAHGIYTIIKEAYDYGHSCGTEEIIRELLAEGASIGNGGDGIETLDYICDQHKKEWIELIVGSYLKNHIKNNSYNLLHRAAAQDSYHYIEVLLERGFDANLVDKYNQTPLHIAAEAGNEDVAITFIQDGKSDINIQDIDGYTPLHCAVENDNFWTVRALLFYERCNVNLQDKHGNTPLHIAISKGYNEIAYLLVDRNCDISVSNLDGISPLQMALAGDNVFIKNLLVNKNDGKELPDIPLDDDLFK